MSADDYLGFDHVQLAAPPDCEERARQFYGGAMGLAEIAKPEALRGAGGVWFRCGPTQLHVGVEKDFRPARKAHPAFRVQNEAALNAIRNRLEAAGAPVQINTQLSSVARFFADDPWGNRLEFVAHRPSEADVETM